MWELWKKGCFYLAQKVKLITVIRILPIPLHFPLLGKQKKKSALDSEFLNRYQEVISGIRFRTYWAIRKLQEKRRVRYVFILFVNQTSCKDCVRQINMLRNTKKKNRQNAKELQESGYHYKWSTHRDGQKGRLDYRCKANLPFLVSHLLGIQVAIMRLSLSRKACTRWSWAWLSASSSTRSPSWTSCRPGTSATLWGRENTQGHFFCVHMKG